MVTGSGDNALSVGSSDQPVTLSAGDVAGDGFSVCWWSWIPSRPSALTTVLALETADSDDLAIALGQTEVRVQYQDSGSVLRDMVAAQHGLLDNDFSEPHHW